MRAHSLLAGLLLGIACGGSVFAQPTPKPVERWWLFHHPANAPTTVGALATASDVIARIRIDGRDVRKTAGLPGAPFPRIFTVYTATVLGAVKGGQQLPAGNGVISIVREGGEYEDVDRVFKAINDTVAELAVGKEYVVALTWDPREGAFAAQFGSEGIFEIRDGTVSPLGASQVADAVRGRPAAAFVTELARRSGQ